MRDDRKQRAVEAIVHPIRYESDPDRWWLSRIALERAVHELAGLAHLFLGSPLPTFAERR